MLWVEDWGGTEKKACSFSAVATEILLYKGMVLDGLTILRHTHTKAY